MKDFWNNPSYTDLLENQQGELNLSYIGIKELPQALNDLALIHQIIYDSSNIYLRQILIESPVSMNLQRVIGFRRSAFNM